MNIVRIMPRQPIEAERINRPPAFRSLGREVLHHDGHETFLSARYWHEVSDPIVWDGTDESFAAIAVALPIGSRVGRSPTNNKLPMHIYLGCGDPVRVPVGWRIQPFSDSFAILPPEVTP